jgi:hypothetical protein
MVLPTVPYSNLNMVLDEFWVLTYQYVSELVLPHGVHTVQSPFLLPVRGREK